MIEGLDSSHDMKEILLTMIKPECNFIGLEEYLFKLVQEDDSIASQSNTPILKSNQKPESQINYECPKIERNSKNNLELEVAYRDQEDYPSTNFSGFTEYEQ